MANKTLRGGALRMGWSLNDLLCVGQSRAAAQSRAPSSAGVFAGSVLGRARLGRLQAAQGLSSERPQRTATLTARHPHLHRGWNACAGLAPHAPSRTGSPSLEPHSPVDPTPASPSSPLPTDTPSVSGPRAGDKVIFAVLTKETGSLQKKEKEAYKNASLSSKIRAFGPTFR